MNKVILLSLFFYLFSAYNCFSDLITPNGNVREYANIRTQPSEPSEYDKIFDKLYKGDYLPLLEETQGWYKVRLKNGLIGYVSKTVSIKIEKDNTNNPNWSNQFSVGSDIATILACFLAIISLIFIYKQIAANNTNAKRVRTYQLITTFYSPEFVGYTAIAKEFLTSTECKKTLWEIYTNKKNPFKNDIKKSCTVFLSFFEDLSFMYNRNLIDKTLTKDIAALLISGWYRNSLWLIEKIQCSHDKVQKDGQGSEIYKEWKKAADALTNL